MRFKVQLGALAALASLGFAAGVAHAATLVTFNATVASQGPGDGVDASGIFGPKGASLDGAAITVQIRVPDGYAGTTLTNVSGGFYLLAPDSVLPATFTVNGITVGCATFQSCVPANAPNDFLLTTAQSALTAPEGAVIANGTSDSQYSTGPGEVTYVDYNFDVGAFGLFGVSNPLDLSTYQGTTWSPPAADPNAFIQGDFALQFVPFQDGIEQPYELTYLNYYGGSVSFAYVPEPAAWALMITGFGLAGAALRRRRAILA